MLLKRIHIVLGTLLLLTALGTHAQAADFGRMPVPEWYDRHKVHLHTRFGLRQYEADIPVSQLAREFGAKVVTRHIKTGAEDVEMVGPDSPLARMVEDARAADVRLIAYYWIAGDDAFLEANPSLTCLNKQGRDEVHRNRGAHLDVTAEAYVAHVVDRLDQIREAGADGYYIDWRHLPPDGCFGTELEASFRAARADLADRDRGDRLYWRHFQQHQSRMMAQALAAMSEPFRDHSNFASIISVTSVPALMSAEMRYDMARVGIPKTELQVPIRPQFNQNVFRRWPELEATRASDGARIAMGVRFLREVSGAPPHVWLDGMETAERIRRSVGTIITYGGIANLDVPEARLLGEKSDALNDAIRAAFETGDRAGEILEGMAPTAAVAVYISEEARNRRNPKAAWLEVMAPAIRAYEVLVEHGVQAAVVDDRVLAEGDLDRYRYLLMPEALTLGEVERGHVEAHPELALRRLQGVPTAQYMKPLLDEMAAAGLVAIEGLPQGAQAVVWRDENEERAVFAFVDAFGDVAEKGVHTPLSQGDFSRVRIRDAGLEEDACFEDLLTGKASENGQLPEFRDWALIAATPCRE